MAAAETRVECVDVENADLLICAYGTASRMAKSIIKQAERELGAKIGLIRPMTAWPYPYAAFEKVSVVPEINIVGQMIDDVRIAVKGRFPVYHCGNTEQGMLNEDDILAALAKVWKEVSK